MLASDYLFRGIYTNGMNKVTNSRFWQACFWFLAIPGLIIAQDSEPPNTQALDIPFTPPTEALTALKMPTGFNATLFAHEPDVIQPIAVTSDSRGRLWVVECLTYSHRKENFDLKLHDRVVILEDVDQDGVFDKRTVFWDKGQKLTGIELGFGGVWLTAAPNLVFVPDADGDDVPDGPPKVLLDGFNAEEIRHNVVNGLQWGPDGWLYGRHGIQSTSLVGPPGSSPSQRTAMNCSIWRYHPQSDEFQIVAEGGTNPWGFDFDDHGEMFMINTVIGHMFHVVPGARFRRMYGAHFNPHTYQVIEQAADHYHWNRSEEIWSNTKTKGMSAVTDTLGGGHAHTGLMCYLGDNWPEQYRNKWFTANFHGRRINVERAERDGCGYTARHEPDMIKSEDPWFRGIEMSYGPDGGVYLLDWSDIGECHENDGIHRTSGRIFKITHGEVKQPADFDLTKWSDTQLVSANAMDNQWFVRHARRILQERATAGEDMAEVKTLLKKFIETQKMQFDESENPDSRPMLRALWALHCVGGTSSPYLVNLTAVGDEHVRAWAVRLLAEQPELSSEAKARLTEMAANDSSGLVRLYIASALNRFAFESDYEIFKSLLSHESDRSDRTQPHLIWHRLEPHVIPNWEQAIQLILDSKIPIVRESIARRIVAEIDSRPEMTSKLAQLLNSGRPEIVSDVVRGMKLALEGRTKIAKPAGWDKVYESVMTHETDEAQRTELVSSIEADLKKINVIFGDGQGIAELRKIAKSKDADVESRRRAIGEYAATRPEDLFSFMRPMASNKALSNAVIKAMVYTDNSNAPQVILNRFPHLDPEGKRIAVDSLTCRNKWAERLLTAVDRGEIPKTAITAQHARQIANFEDAALTAKLAKVWGTVRQSDAIRLEEMKRVRELCTENVNLTRAKDLARYQVGKKLFVEKCSSCHVMHGAGKNVGPDLTGGDRKNISYLLENIIDPNASVADSFRATKFVLDDGRFVTGVILQETPQVTRIQTATEIATIETREIEDSKPTKLSLMPEGLLEKMSDDETRALFHFLSSDRK